MNVYEQLVGLKENLQERGAQPQSIRVIDKMLTMAQGQRDSALSVSRLQVLRHVMSSREVLDNEDVRLDFIGLQGDLEEAAAQRSQEAPEVEADLRRPKLKKYYKKK